MTLAAFSASLSQLVAAAAPFLSAIRVAPNRHITGLVFQGDMIVTIDQALPVLDSYNVVLSNQTLIAARPGLRNPGANLALLHLDLTSSGANQPMATASLGGLAVVLGADVDASPTVCLTVIHRFVHTADGPAPVLDLPSGSIHQGSLVLDANGHLLGVAGLGPNGEVMAIPSAIISRIVPSPGASPPASARLATPSPPPTTRGWLGVALQPITVPDQLVARAGQASGRMVVSITKGGPADMAGMRVGDVLLSLDGTSATGPQALRAFLGSDRVGTVVEVKLLRDGNLLTTQLAIAVQPGLHT